MRGMGTNASHFDFLAGATIKQIYDTGDSDCGLILELDNGLCLYFGYNGGEGNTIIVTKEDDLIEGEQDGFPVFSLRKGLV